MTRAAWRSSATATSPGVACDGRWILVEGRARITQATREWQTLRAMKHQLAE